MTNNDLLRRIRYIFDFDDAKMISIFNLVGKSVTRAQVSDWLKKDDDEAYQNLSDKQFATFLNGLIVEQRGKKEGIEPQPESALNNNIILMKLKIALNLKSEDVIDILQLADFRISKPELSAFSRKQGHKHYRECKDQVLRNFFTGLQRKYRAQDENTGGFVWPK